MALPHGTAGSLGPAFAPARGVPLAVRRASTLALDDRLPTGLSPPLYSSVTLLEETAPVKLTAWQGSPSRFRDRGEVTNANRVVFHRRLPPGRDPGIDASHLSYAVHTRHHCQG